MNMLYSNGYIVTYRKTRSLLQSVTGANTRQLTTVRVVRNGFQLLIPNQIYGLKIHLYKYMYNEND